VEEGKKYTAYAAFRRGSGPSRLTRFMVGNSLESVEQWAAQRKATAPQEKDDSSDEDKEKDKKPNDFVLIDRMLSTFGGLKPLIAVNSGIFQFLISNYVDREIYSVAKREFVHISKKRGVEIFGIRQTMLTR
jgi:hypothetical protein